MRKSLLVTCFALFIIFSSVFSQELPKTLLWKISGNGLTKPSYIYGTMHLADPRLFILGDSLLNAISKSEGFANELELNQITPLIIDMMKQEISNLVSIKQIVSKKTLDQYGPALAKKFNKPAGEITTMDILKEKNKWINESFKGKKMQTFLDPYLTDLADKQGKWIGGIEDYSDQSGLVNSVVDESDIKELVMGSGTGDGTGEKSEMETMTTIYLNGDLEGFQHLINGMDSNYRDQLLIKRNHKMAFRMDSLARTRSTVFAVGAAHLPGEEGLIQLLRARGFNVDPVYSSKKVKPEDYAVHGVPRPWVEVHDAENLYKVMMPGIPGKIRLFGILPMQIYFNIFNGTFYMTFSTPLPYGGRALDSVKDAVLKQFFGGQDYKVERALEINGIPGKSFFQKNNDGYKKIYLLDKENMMYLAVGFSGSDAETSMQAINQFFDSYQPILPAHDQHPNSFAFVDSVRFYGMLMPSKPNPVDNLTPSDKTVKSIVMVSTDPQTSAYYFCGFNECKKGYAFQNDSAVIRITRENLLKKMADITRDTTYTKNNRRILEMNGSMLNGAVWVKTIITVRGNRSYTAMIMYPPGKWIDEMNKKLTSFHLDNYPNGVWTNASAPDSLFTTWAPAGFSYSDGKGREEIVQYPHYISFDSNRVHSYVLRIDTLDNYFWRKNDSLFWAFERDRFVTSSDTLISEKTLKKDGYFQYEFLGKPKEANNILRMHMWLRGNLIYRITTVQEPETIREENVNRFFDQFHFNWPAEETHVFDSKAMLLLNDLQSADTMISRKANKLLPDAPFEESDIPLLRKAVLVSYPDDNILTNSTNGEIAERIIELNDSSSIVFAGAHFREAKDEEVKNALLDILSARHTSANYDSLGKLLVESPPKYAFPTYITRKWKDSLEVAAHLFPTILPLLKDSLHARGVLDLADALLDDSLISMAIFRPWQKAILQYAYLRFRKTKADTLNFTVSDYSVIYMLQRMKTDSCNAMLKKWLGVKNNDYHKQAIVLALLKNNQTVNATVLQELAANEYTRLDLYRNLKDYKKTGIFPAKYLTQSSFAEGLAREAAERFNEDGTEITFLDIKQMKYKGKTGRFFLYDLKLETDDSHWLTISGPFNINRTSISLSEADSDVYSEEQYDAKNVDSLAKALLLQMNNK